MGYPGVPTRPLGSISVVRKASRVLFERKKGANQHTNTERRRGGFYERRTFDRLLTFLGFQLRLFNATDIFTTVAECLFCPQRASARTSPEPPELEAGELTDKRDRGCGS